MTKKQTEYQKAYAHFEKTGEKFEVFMSSEGGSFFVDPDDEQGYESSDGCEILDEKTANEVYNNSNYGHVELRQYQNHDDYVILKSKGE